MGTGPLQAAGGGEAPVKSAFAVLIYMFRGMRKDGQKVADDA